MGRVIIVGGGQAGCALAARLRSQGHEGEIVLFGAEPVPPYQRPPLSKAYLTGEMAEARLYLRPEEWYADEGIALRTGTPVTAVDPAARTVSAGGETLSYDALALTTGAVPRTLAPEQGGDLGGVYTLRTLADVDRMAPAFAQGARALIVGGGYIGLEAAAVARKLGVAVTLIEMAPRILQRVAAPETSDYVRALHRRHGVEILEGTALDRLTGAAGQVAGAVLTGGREVAADFVLVGAGVLPDVALAQGAGLESKGGIVVDDRCRTSAPGVWAAGDCTVFPFRGGLVRLESVQNAIDQAECAADNILGADRAYDPVPWFWSDQYDVKLQIAGLNLGYDRVVTRPGAAEGQASTWYYRGDTLLAVDAMNEARTYMVAKRLIEGGKSPAAEVVADPATDLKALLRA
ncbi:pyridine nucleotide-disulfide oxidoreductase [Rhodobacteraceae bacterium CCMM004]|nr:pyridine nucleotide-disulfide oxidoreductase [Rhodobacteraceae bacterium CCMM004]